MLLNAQDAQGSNKNNANHYNQDRISARAQIGSGGLSTLIPSNGSTPANPLSAG